MTVIDAIAAATGLDHAKSEAAAGAILGAIRLSAPAEAFAPLERALPNARDLILRSGTVMTGGRTGEMTAMITELKSSAGVVKLTGQLGRAGITPEQVAQAARALVRFVRQQEGEDAVRPMLDALPGFRELVQ